MISKRDIELTTDIVRSFSGRPFTTEQMKAKMAHYPPKARVSARIMANILKQQKLAVVIGNVPNGMLGSTGLWRPLQ